MRSGESKRSDSLCFALKFGWQIHVELYVPRALTKPTSTRCKCMLSLWVAGSRESQEETLTHVDVSLKNWNQQIAI